MKTKAGVRFEVVFDVGLEVEEVHDHGHQGDHPRVHRGHDPGAPAALRGIVFGKVLIVVLFCQKHPHHITRTRKEKIMNIYRSNRYSTVLKAYVSTYVG